MRQESLIRVALAVGVINFLACGRAELPKVTPTPTPDALLEMYHEYPALQNTAYPLTSKLRLEVRSGVPTTILNFSSYSLNEQTVNEIYRTVDFFANADDPIMVRYRLDDQEIIVGGTGLPRLKSRTMSIVPADLPRPNWSDDLDLTNITAATTYRDDRAQFSYVETAPDKRLSPLSFFNDSVQKATTLGMSIEACQQTLRAAAFDRDFTTLLPDPSLHRMAQEILCNSMGLAISSRLLNLPYGEYRAYAESYASGNPTLETQMLPLIPFPEDSIRNIKPTGPVIN